MKYNGIGDAVIPYMNIEIKWEDEKKKIWLWLWTNELIYWFTDLNGMGYGN